MKFEMNQSRRTNFSSPRKHSIPTDSRQPFASSRQVAEWTDGHQFLNLHFLMLIWHLIIKDTSGDGGPSLLPAPPKPNPLATRHSAPGVVQLAIGQAGVVYRQTPPFALLIEVRLTRKCTLAKDTCCFGPNGLANQGTTVVRDVGWV